MTRTTTVIAAGLALAAALPIVPAHAAARDRVFVASYGSDSNPCTFGSPCKTFQAAITAVASGGEVTAIDSAGFGPISITKPVTITSPAGIEAGIVPVSGGDGITINTSGTVLLRGLTIEGNGSGVDGIALSNADALTIVDCVIRHFTHDGMYLQPAAYLRLSILNVIASDNGNDGIDISPTSINGLSGVIDHSTATNNSVDGMNVWGANGSGEFLATAEMTIVNSVAANNGNNGITASTTAGGFKTLVMVRDTTASYNNQAGVAANGTSQIILAHSEATGNGATGINIVGTGVSFGDNHIYYNGSFGITNVSGTLTPASFY